MEGDFKKLLIVPYGIEIRLTIKKLLMLILLIVPYGIEMYFACI